MSRRSTGSSVANAAASSGNAIGSRRARRRSLRDHRQQQCRVRDSARHRTLHAVVRLRDRASLVRHDAGRRAVSDHAAVTRRNAQAAAVIGTGRQRRHVRCHRNGRTARRTTARARDVERIAGGAEQTIHGVRADAELGHVGFADDDAAGGANPRNDAGVCCRHVVFERFAAVRRANARGVLNVLDRNRQAVQRAERFAAPHRRFGIARLFAGALVGAHHHRVDGRIDALDLRDARIDAVRPATARARRSIDELRRRSVRRDSCGPRKCERSRQCTKDLRECDHRQTHSTPWRISNEQGRGIDRRRHRHRRRGCRAARGRRLRGSRARRRNAQSGTRGFRALRPRAAGSDRRCTEQTAAAARCARERRRHRRPAIRLSA